MLNKSKGFCVDNLGIKQVMVFKIFKKKLSLVGDFLLVSIKNYKIKKKNLKSKIFKALLINSKKKKRRLDGFSLNCFFNNLVLVSSDNLIGNKINTFFDKEVYKKLYKKKLLNKICFYIKLLI